MKANFIDNFTKVVSPPPEQFEFPPDDKKGNPLTDITETEITGITHMHGFADPQYVLKTIYENEQLILEADPYNEHDKYAVKIKKMNGIQFGWIPRHNVDTIKMPDGTTIQIKTSDNPFQIDISNRLNNGGTVLARAKRLYYVNKADRILGLIIEVARY